MVPPAWLCSSTRRCGPPSVRWLWCSSAIPGQHPLPPYCHSCPPAPPNAPSVDSPALRQGDSDHILPGSEHGPQHDPAGAGLWTGTSPVPPLFQAAHAWVWCAHRPRMKMLGLAKLKMDCRIKQWSTNTTSNTMDNDLDDFNSDGSITISKGIFICGWHQSQERNQPFW